PGFYSDGEYDIAGFIVGVVERDRIITGERVEIGDVILGLPSNGLHTNGYSLARKLFFEIARYTPETFVSEIKNKAGKELMRTYNMGIGMILVVPANKFKRVQSILDRINEKSYTIGRIVKGDRKVIYS